VDDSDPRIAYSADGWFTGGSSGLECNATTHGSNGTHATASLSFTGVGIQVFGTVGAVNESQPGSNGSGSPASTYQIDKSPATTFVFPANNQANYRTQFYASPLLEPGSHTLVITAIGNNGSQLWLDYILYYPSN
ncbi:hypothetical protein BDP27DRAFT_1155123, partial [Rhodocollybia butyracea]